MNCPSRADPEQPDGYNQNPNALNADATTRADLEHMASARLRCDHRIDHADDAMEEVGMEDHTAVEDQGWQKGAGKRRGGLGRLGLGMKKKMEGDVVATDGSVDGTYARRLKSWRKNGQGVYRKAWASLRTYLKFVGPGFMVAVAYIDPGNYATDVAAGASFRFRLLFIILMSNIFAIFLQSLCIKLGSVTGLNLAENCKAHLPTWLNYILYFFAESAIIATDIAEVIGTAIALNILLKIPLVAGCVLSVVDVLIILIFYRPSGKMKSLRAFELFVMCLVLGVVVCFCFELSKIKAPVGEVFRGYLPSSTLIKPQALYQSCGILGATVMPHSLYLGSGIVQPRLREFDLAHPDNTSRPVSIAGESDADSTISTKYKPSLAAIRACMRYSIVELALSLFTFALFVNSSILIIAGASLSSTPEAADADLFSIHALLSSSIAPVAGTLFALALLLSGTSAGIVCTIAGQMVSEGQLNLRLKPWKRRLLTRSLSIVPSVVVAGAVGREGLGKALMGSQVCLSIILPVVSAPLLWFTCRAGIMRVDSGGGGTLSTSMSRLGSGSRSSTRGVGVDIHSGSHEAEREARADGEGEREGHAQTCVQMRNSWLTTAVALLVWGVVVVMNGALLVLLGLGVA